MERKIRNRNMKNDAKLMLIKLLPWLFIVLMFLISTSIGTSASGGPVRPGID